MSIKDEIKHGRKPRSKNGERRQSSVWNIRDVSESTRDDVKLLSAILKANQAHVIELAISNLKQSLVAEHQEKKRYCKTISPNQDDLSWLLDKNEEPSNHKSVIELEERLEKRKLARDVLMGRTQTTSSHRAVERLKDA